MLNIYIVEFNIQNNSDSDIIMDLFVKWLNNHFMIMRRLRYRQVINFPQIAGL